ncbi:MAG: hypothetical protein BRC22_01020 [Parcubacteria group bacterium QH_9_35_7]|nr:MAG: hypothetical protein BRC22_01020 [Parcubacteria group bacterium QH_9_35_7]
MTNGVTKIVKKLFLAFLPPLITFIVYFILFFGSFNVNIEFWSVVFHFLGGFTVSWSIWLLEKKFSSWLHFSSSFILAIFIVSVTGLVGILWEFWEWSMDFYFGLNFLGDVNDTLFDLFMDLIGSITIVCYLFLVDKLTILSR